MAILLASACASASARADLLPARDTADVGVEGSWSIGLIAPLTYAISDGLEVQTHPLFFLVAPNFVVRAEHGQALGFRFAGEYGAFCPTPAMRLTQGYLFPSWAETGGQIGWVVVPHAGIVATRGNRYERTLSFSVDAALGVPLTHGNPISFGGVAPVDDELAPVTTGFRVRLNATYDAAILSWLRARAWLTLSLHGRNPSPVGVSAGGGFDLGVYKAWRVTAGFMWWNADTGAIDEASHAHVRSNDFFPTLDFIWAG